MPQQTTRLTAPLPECLPIQVKFCERRAITPIGKREFCLDPACPATTQTPKTASRYPEPLPQQRRLFLGNTQQKHALGQPHGLADQSPALLAEHPLQGHAVFIPLTAQAAGFMLVNDPRRVELIIRLQGRNAQESAPPGLGSYERAGFLYRAEDHHMLQFHPHRTAPLEALPRPQMSPAPLLLKGSDPPVCLSSIKIRGQIRLDLHVGLAWNLHNAPPLSKQDFF